MFFFPINYEEPLFRPPSEARSLILQVTTGCSWNSCIFCEMYTSKSFKSKSFQKIQEEIQIISDSDLAFNKVFLADGDALVLSTKKLMAILDEVNKQLKGIRRISAYAKPKDIARKSIEDLKKLKDAGLDLLYVGIESGDDQVLQLIEKGETFKSTAEGLLKAKKAGIKLSVMVLNGLGGKELSMQHAINSAKLVTEIQAEFLSTLVLSFPFGKDHFLKRLAKEFTFLNTYELLEEMKVFLEHTEAEQTVFRSDHASNYLVLKGILSRDKDELCQKIETVLNDPQSADLREEWQRGL